MNIDLVRKPTSGKSTVISGAIAAALLLSAVLGCNKFASTSNPTNSSNSSSAANGGTSTRDVPSDSEVEALVKKTTAQFADAVDSEDFTTLYNDASEDFQATYTVGEMKKTFDSYIEKKSVVVPILKKAQDTAAEFTKPPSLRKEKGLDILVTSGKFDTKPYDVRFEYEYVNRHNEWKLLKMVINIP